MKKGYIKIKFLFFLTFVWVFFATNLLSVLEFHIMVVSYLLTYNDHLDDFGITIHERMCFSRNSSVFGTSRRLNSWSSWKTRHTYVILTNCMLASFLALKYLLFLHRWFSQNNWWNITWIVKLYMYYVIGNLRCQKNPRNFFKWYGKDSVG